MQQGHTPDTSEPRENKVDLESKSSTFTSSSSAGIPPDSPGDGSHYGDDEPVTYETIEDFPGTTNLDPRRGYVRHVRLTEAGSSSGAAGATSGGKYSWSSWGLCWPIRCHVWIA